MFFYTGVNCDIRHTFKGLNMLNKKKIVDAKNDSNGCVIAVKLEGNSTFTNLNTAIGMAKKGIIDAVVVNPKKGNGYLRTRPDGITKNNLDSLAK